MYFDFLIVNISNSIFKSLFHIYFIVKDFFLCFSGCISNSDSGDDSVGTQASKLCEPFQGKLSNAEAGITFQVYKVNSAIKLLFSLLMLLGEFGIIVYLCVYFIVIKKYYKLKMYTQCDI